VILYLRLQYNIKIKLNCCHCVTQSQRCELILQSVPCGASLFLWSGGLARTKGLRTKWGLVPSLAPHNTTTALLYGMHNAVDTNTTHSCTDWLQIDLRNLPLAPQSPRKRWGAYWPRGGAKFRLASPRRTGPVYAIKHLLTYLLTYLPHLVTIALAVASDAIEVKYSLYWRPVQFIVYCYMYISLLHCGFNGAKHCMPARPAYAICCGNVTLLYVYPLISTRIILEETAKTYNQANHDESKTSLATVNRRGIRKKQNRKQSVGY